jgi:chemosensory pili system protein ChpE
MLLLCWKRPALAVQIGSLVGDALWAILGLVGIGLLLQLDWLRWPIGVAGVIYLLWLARDSWRAAGVEFSLAGGELDSKKSALRAGVLLSVTNPQNIAYWAALGSAMGAVGVHEPTAMDYGVFFAGFMVSSVVWAFFCAAVVDGVFARGGQRWAKATYRLCAIAFVALALGALRDLVSPEPSKPGVERPATSSTR